MKTAQACKVAIGVLSIAFGLSAAAPAAAETWRMASKMPHDSPEGKVFQHFADKVKEFSKGDLNVTIFPNEQLGKSDAVMEQLKLGTVHLYAEGSSYLRKWVPDISWISAAFLFDDRAHWVRFMNTGLAQKWFNDASKKAGIGMIGDPTAILRGPYRVMVTNKDIKSFADVKSVKLRMHPNKLAHAIWTHLGADVRTLAWTDVYQSIDKGIVQAVNSPIALVESMRFHEVAPHVIRHDEYYQSIGFMVNQKAYEKLSTANRTAIDEAHAAAGQFSFKVMDAAANDSLARMKKSGVSFLEIDRAPFVQSMSEFYQKLETQGKLPAGYMAAVKSARKAK